MKTKICGIYKITCICKEWKGKPCNSYGKVYIGQSTDIYSRWGFEHLIRPNAHFDSAWKKYGSENFKFEILKECPKEDLNQLKFFFQCVHCSFDSRFGFNKVIGHTNGWTVINKLVKEGKLQHGMKNHVWTKEQRENMSKGRKGISTNNAWKRGERKWTLEELEYNRQKHLGKHHSEKSKQIMSENMKGQKWWNNGQKCVRSREQPEGFKPGRL
jgi:hypothetical protein